MAELKKCPDCGGELEKGAIADFSYGAVLPQQYSTGEIIDSKLVVTGRRFKKIDNFRYVTTYRCLKCQRLFSYAAETSLPYSKYVKNQWQVLLAVFGVLAVVYIIVMAIVFSTAGY